MSHACIASEIVNFKWRGSGNTGKCAKQLRQASACSVLNNLLKRISFLECSPNLKLLGVEEELHQDSNDKKFRRHLLSIFPKGKAQKMTIPRQERQSKRAKRCGFKQLANTWMSSRSWCVTQDRLQIDVQSSEGKTNTKNCFTFHGGSANIVCFISKTAPDAHGFSFFVPFAEQRFESSYSCLRCFRCNMEILEFSVGKKESLPSIQKPQILTISGRQVWFWKYRVKSGTGPKDPRHRTPKIYQKTIRKKSKKKKRMSDILFSHISLGHL